MALACARRQHRHRRLIGMHHWTAQHMRLQAIHQRLQPHPANPDPGGQGGARNSKSRPPEDRLLAVQWQMVRMLGYQHVGQQAGRGDPLVDHFGGNRGLHQGAAAAARPFAAYMALYREHARRVVQLLTDVLGNALEHAAAGACRGVWLVSDLTAWQEDYNTCRPHGSLGHLTPSEFVKTRSVQQAESCLTPV